MEIYEFTIDDFDYIPGDTLADRNLLTEAEVIATWDIEDPLPEGGSWATVPCINADERKREGKTRRTGWIPEVLGHPLVRNNRLSEHWSLAMEIAAHRDNIGYNSSCFEFD